jgi:hypothetical protein
VVANVHQLPIQVVEIYPEKNSRSNALLKKDPIKIDYKFIATGYAKKLNFDIIKSFKISLFFF